jgi:hypothetical protein
MTKHLSLLLFIGLAWGQDDSGLDVIEMKTGFIYKGKITNASPSKVTILPQYESTSLTISRKEIEKITTPVSRGEVEIENSDIIYLSKQKPPLFSSGSHLQRASTCLLLNPVLTSLAYFYMNNLEIEDSFKTLMTIQAISGIITTYAILQIGEAGDGLKKASLKLAQQEKELKRISKELERKKND